MSEITINPDQLKEILKSAIVELYQVRQITYDMSLRMQRSGMKQSQSFGIATRPSQ